ncbi:MAG: ribbon-helix-helix protein, CopG family [Nitriliruptoraceae bacterium]
MTKGFTVRLEEDQAAELEAIAKADGVSVAEEIRRAITVRIAERRGDAEFQARIRGLIEKNQKILDRLAQ